MVRSILRLYMACENLHLSSLTEIRQSQLMLKHRMTHSRVRKCHCYPLQRASDPASTRSHARRFSPPEWIELVQGIKFEKACGPSCGSIGRRKVTLGHQRAILKILASRFPCFQAYLCLSLVPSDPLPSCQSFQQPCYQAASHTLKIQKSLSHCRPPCNALSSHAILPFYVSI